MIFFIICLCFGPTNPPLWGITVMYKVAAVISVTPVEDIVSVKVVLLQSFP